MSPRYCEVALPVPLRSTFTYAVPASLNGEPLIGRRVVVPFRNRAVVGIALAESNRRPENPPDVRIKEIAELMDARPALPPKLIELGEWIGRYYLAPIGEAFRAMLPPEIELRHDREYSLTNDGEVYLSQFLAGTEGATAQADEVALLREFSAMGEAVSSARVRRGQGGEAAVQKLVRRGLLAARDVVRHRKSRMQRIVAWNGEAPQASLATTPAAPRKQVLPRTKRKTESAKSSPRHAVRFLSRFSSRKQKSRVP